jgi:hypothetical protein
MAKILADQNTGGKDWIRPQSVVSPMLSFRILQVRSATSAAEMRVQQQQTGNNRQYRITKQMNPMTHFFTISLNHYGQFFNVFRRRFSLIKTIQPINNREHSDHKIYTDIHVAMVTELMNKQYRQFDNVEQPCHNLTWYPTIRPSLSKSDCLKKTTAKTVSGGIVYVVRTFWVVSRLI